VALLVSFTAARAAVQLTVTERPGPASAGWAAAAGMLTEFVVYAALAASSGVAAQNAAAQNSVGLNGIFGGSLRNTFVRDLGWRRQVGVWRLAVAVMLLLGPGSWPRSATRAWPAPRGRSSPAAPPSGRPGHHPARG